MAGKVSGIARIKVNADLLESLPGAELDLGGFKRTAVLGHSNYGPREELMPSELTFKIVWRNSTQVETLRNAVDALVTFESDNGQTYQIANAFTAETIKVGDKDNDVSVKMQGDPAVLL